MGECRPVFDAASILAASRSPSFSDPHHPEKKKRSST
jgi:hypothetical protein